MFGCATYPKDPENQATYHIEKAKSALIAGDKVSVADNIDQAFSRYSGDIKVKSFFNNHPKAEGYYYSFLEKEIVNIEYPYQAIALSEKISSLKNAEVFDEEKINSLSNIFQRVIKSGNTSGKIKFSFSDDLNKFPYLNTPEHLKIIANRTISDLIENTNSNRPVKELMNYIQKTGINSQEAKVIQSQLANMNIRANELDYVYKVFPKFAISRKADVSMKALLTFKNTNRLIADDLSQSLRRKSKGIEWVNSNNERDVVITIELLRNEEKNLPEKTETISYSQYDVNALQAALFMPRNASYLYEVTSGGAEIEYGYAISINQKGRKIYDDTIRGRVNKKYQHCKNARIQNVFGGVVPANFIANDHMQKTCSQNESISIDSLRQEVFDKITDSILSVEPIRKIQMVN